MEKYHKTDIAPVENENERDENCQADNPQIDPTRTRENYNMVTVPVHTDPEKYALSEAQKFDYEL